MFKFSNNNIKKMFLLIPIMFCILLFLTEAHAKTYYVDFDSGNNSNNGFGTDQAWRSLPGTQNPTGGSSGWEVIAAGDTIYIKGGTVYDSGDGGEILINSTWYNNGTSSNYISIQISNTWGSGNVSIDGTGVTIPRYWGLFSIYARNYIEVKGSSSNRLIVTNSSQRGFLSQGTSGTHQLGIKLRYMDFNYASGDAGCNFSYSDNFEVRDCTANHNQYVGFGLGGGNDQNCDGGKFYDCEAYHNGDSSAGGGSVHGFGLYGCTNIEYWRCTSHSNHRDGFDFGTTSDTNNVSVKLVNCASYSNGEDGFALNGGPSGMRTGYYINCISYNNGATGFNFYSGGITAYVYHSLADNNTHNLIAYDEDEALDVKVHVKNSIMYKNTSSAYGNIRRYYTKHVAGTKFYTDYNLWVKLYEPFAALCLYPSCSGADVINYNGTSRPTVWNAETKDYLPDTNQDDDHSGWDQDPAFVDVNNHDYHPTESSWTIGKGVYISDPIEAAMDKDGVARLNPPTIGPYEFGENKSLNPPLDFRIIK